MEPEQIVFEHVKEDRGWYFVEYAPPIPCYRFATLSLVIPGEASDEKIAQAMEIELQRWLERYPIPIMISAFGATEDLIYLTGVRDANHLMGFLAEDSKTIKSYWRVLNNDEMPDCALDQIYLKAVYSDISFRTEDQILRQAERQRKARRFGWFFVFVWTVIAPAAFAILAWSSKWLATAVAAYSLWKAVEKTLRLTGKWPKSQRERKKDADELRMRHYYYHCERNPAGFARLRNENFEREERENVRKEAESLKKR